MKAFPNKQMTNFHHISNVGGEVVTSTNTLFKVSDELQFLIDIRYQHVTMLEASDDDLIFRNSSFFHLLPSNFLLIFRGWDGGERKVVECTHMKREEKDKKKRFKDSKKKMTMYHRCLQCWLTMTLECCSVCCSVEFSFVDAVALICSAERGNNDVFWFKFWKWNVHNLRNLKSEKSLEFALFIYAVLFEIEKQIFQKK